MSGQAICSGLHREIEKRSKGGEMKEHKYIRRTQKFYESKLFGVSLMVVFIFTTALWIYKLIELIIGGIK